MKTNKVERTWSACPWCTSTFQFPNSCKPILLPMLKTRNISFETRDMTLLYFPLGPIIYLMLCWCGGPLLFCHHHSASLHHQTITNEINPIFLPMHWGQCWQLKLTNTKSTQNILTCPTKNKVQIYDDVKFPNGELLYLFD